MVGRVRAVRSICAHGWWPRSTRARSRSRRRSGSGCRCTRWGRYPGRRPPTGSVAPMHAWLPGLAGRRRCHRGRTRRGVRRRNRRLVSLAIAGRPPEQEPEHDRAGRGRPRRGGRTGMSPAMTEEGSTTAMVSASDCGGRCPGAGGGGRQRRRRQARADARAGRRCRLRADLPARLLPGAVPVEEAIKTQGAGGRARTPGRPGEGDHRRPGRRHPRLVLAWRLRPSSQLVPLSGLRARPVSRCARPPALTAE
jgi:hypothetical protein